MFVFVVVVVEGDTQYKGWKDGRGSRLKGEIFLGPMVLTLRQSGRRRAVSEHHPAGSHVIAGVQSRVCKTDITPFIESTPYVANCTRPMEELAVV